LGLFAAAGIILFVLLVASYSRRGPWIAFGSMAFSMTLLIGCLFLATIHDRDQIRASLAWVGSRFPALLDRQTTEELLASIEQVEAPWSCGSGCGKEKAAAPLLTERPPVRAAATTSDWFNSRPNPQATSQSALAWNLDDQHVELPVKSPRGFSLSGTNVSDAVLEQVHAVLKPDSDRREVPLVLSVEDDIEGSVSTIPAGARFSLFPETSDERGSVQTGGAILKFRYVQAGQSKSSILYLTPEMISRFANR
jgi:hypothetical protein